MKTDKEKALEIIGSTEYVEIAGIKNIPAKIDTGADTSSIWASNIDMKEDKTLTYSLFAPGHPFYNGEVFETNDYAAKLVRSSNGATQVRYRVKIPVTIGGRTLETTFTLANRSRNKFPILIGRHTIEGNFLVDVAKSSVLREKKLKTKALNTELKENPYKFHQKYIKQRRAK